MIKSKKHLFSFPSCFGILLGIILFFGMPLGSDLGETGSSFFDSNLIELVSENHENTPANDESSPADALPELIVKQAVELEKPSLEVPGIALLLQSGSSPDAGFVSLLWTISDVVQKLILSSSEYVLRLKNSATHLIIHLILRRSGTIAIHAP